MIKEKKEGKPKKIREAMSETLSLPKELILNLPKIVLIGNSEVTVENYKGLIEYSEELIRLNTVKHIIKITGEKMLVKYITDEDILIKGDIKNIEFIL